MHPSGRRSAYLLCLALILLLVLAPAALARDVAYRLRPGDTLSAIAAGYLVEGRSFHDLQRHNRVAMPKRLRAGRTISIPRTWLRIEPQFARLAAVQGDVRIEVEGRAGDPAPGLRLPVQALVATSARSFAAIAFADGSLVSVLPNSRVRLTTHETVVLTGETTRQIRVESGRVTVRVTPVRPDQGDSFRVLTPLAVAAVRGTQFRTVVDPVDGRSQFEVIEGTVAVAAQAEALVSGGQAVAATPEGIGATHRLLGAPHLAHPGRVQDGETLAFQVADPGAAVGWHATLARDAGFVERIDEVFSAVPQIVFPDQPDATYFVRIAALSATGFEGLPRDYAIQRSRYRFRATVAPDGPLYRFRWLAAADGTSRFRFVLRHADYPDLPVVDALDLAASEITISNLAPGTYRWMVGRWSPGAENPDIEWDEERELVIVR